MAIRDLAVMFDENFDNVPSFFSQKHGQLVVRGLGQFAEEDNGEELVENFTPFIPELALAGKRVRLRVQVVSIPLELSQKELAPDLIKYYPMGGIVFTTDTSHSEPVWIYLRDQVVSAPDEGYTGYIPCPAPGCVFSIEQLWPEPVM